MPALSPNGGYASECNDIKFIASNESSPGGAVQVSVITYWIKGIVSNTSRVRGDVASVCINILNQVQCQPCVQTAAVQVSVMLYWIRFIVSNESSPEGRCILVTVYCQQSVQRRCVSQCNNILVTVYCQQSVQRALCQSV